MPLDPHLQGMLALFEAFGPPPISTGTPEAARRALRLLTVDVRVRNSIVPVGSVTERTVRGEGGRLRLRTYRPEGARAIRRPTIVFFHGGGFVIGDLDTHDNLCRRLCREVDAVVVSVDYRLAPDHPFPAAIVDCMTAARWVAEHVTQLGGDSSRLVVAGDSAGGNLAAVITQGWRGEVARGRPPLAAQLLLYPVVDLEDDDGVRYPSRQERAQDTFLSGDDLRWFGDHYVGAVIERSDPRLSPIHGELAGLPPAVIVTAEFDPLRDEGEAYAAALEAAGVRVEHRRFAGLIHGFFDLAAVSPACAAAVGTTCRLLRDLLGHADRSSRR